MSARGHTAIDLELAGERYTLRTDADEEYARRCADLVDERMCELAGEFADPRKAGIMAALSLADDLLKTRAEVESRSREMVARIEEATG